MEEEKTEVKMVEVDEHYMLDMENQNKFLYEENRKLKLHISSLNKSLEEIKKDIATLAYVASVKDAQNQIFSARLIECGVDPNGL